MTSLLQDKLYEVHMQAPPPSKDFHHLTITKNEVIWRSWKISFRPNQEKILPREVKKLHKDFVLDEQLHSNLEEDGKPSTKEWAADFEQLQGIFGKKMLDYVLNLCQEHYDFLVRMPEKLIMHILSFLNVEDIGQLSKTCKKFRKLCSTEEFWEKIKRLQDSYNLDAKTITIPAYKRPSNSSRRPGYLAQMQRRQTTFF